MKVEYIKDVYEVLTMKKTFLVIFALIILLTPPVSGYMLLKEYTSTGSSYTDRLYHINVTGADLTNNVTYWEFTGDTWYISGNLSQLLSGSMTFWIQKVSNAAMQGNASCSWTSTLQSGAYYSTTIHCNKLDYSGDSVSEHFFYTIGGGWSFPYTGGGDTDVRFKKDSANQCSGVNCLQFGDNSNNHYAGHYKIYGGTAYNPPVASFTATPDSGYPPLTVSFNDTSTVGTSPITSWLWDFNDFATSTHPSNASHQYILNGTYNASLTVSDGTSNSTAYKNITIGNPPAIPGSSNLHVHVKDGSAVNIQGAHISLLVSNGTVLTNYTDVAGMSHFYSIPNSAAAIIDVTKAGYPEYIETFSITNDTTKEITLGAGGAVKLYVDIKDSIYGSYIDSVNIGIKNTTSNVWRNASGHSGAVYYDSTGANFEYPLAIGQTVIVAGSKTGYRPDSKSVTITQDGQLVTLLLVNINGSAPSSGNFTAVIAARNMLTGLEIPGASITINELGRMAGTNNAGVAMFYNVPIGSYTLLGAASGFNSATGGITGTNLETVMASINLLPAGYHQNENGTIIDPDGNPYQPWNPDYPGSPGYTGGNNTGNEKAAAGLNAFLDHIVEIGLLILVLILFWFCKKIFFT